MTLTPKMAAAIANKVYTLRQERDWAQLVSEGANSINTTLDIQGDFSVDAGSGRFQGTSGGNILRAKSGFGYIASGTGLRQQELLIAIRGTVSAYDWVTDAMQTVRIGPGGYPVHAGFQNTFESFQPTIREFFAKSKSKPAVVHVVGHSLGGALATLVADYLSEMKMPTKLYTFGCPRTGFEGFSRNLTKKLGAENVFRVHHAADPVAMVPIFPFFHAPFDVAGLMLPWDGSPVSFSAHKMGNYIQSIGDDSWVGLKRSPPGAWGTAENWLAKAATNNSGIKMYSAKSLWIIMKCLEWILKEVGGGVVGSLAFGTVTIVDALARLLYQGTLTSVKIGNQVTNLMTSIMKFLGRTMVVGVTLTASFIKWTLDLLFQFLSSTAQLALQKWDKEA